MLSARILFPMFATTSAVWACGGTSDGARDTAFEQDASLDGETTEPDDRPSIETSQARTLPVPTAVGLPAISGFTVDTAVHPHGLVASWHIEYGPTDAYGSTTAERALPGRLTAHFAEDWSAGTNGWLAGFSGVQLVHHASGGPADGPFVRYTDEQTAGNDVNHLDGIGLIHLGPYAYIGNYYWAEVPPLYLGGGFPDLRGARVSASLRGVDWDGRGSELGTWIQGYRDPTVVEVVPEDSRYPNYAFTGDLQTRHLASGTWESASWVLRNRTPDWTFAGANGGRLLYDYGELDGILGGVNVDFFLLQILHVDINDQPSGAIDFADMQLTYRQRSLCAPSNGGHVVVSPGESDASVLVDGWRNGPEREWQSAPRPAGPQRFEVAFDVPVTVRSINVHNAVVNPSKDFEVSLSADGGQTWTVVASGTLPDASERGPNYAFHHTDAYVLVDGVAVWAPLYDRPVDRLRVDVLSGYTNERWGLGEIEAFGTGARETTDDDWYDLNQDVRVAPGTWHFRVVATNSAGTRYGPDQQVVVPVLTSEAR